MDSVPPSPSDSDNRPPRGALIVVAVGLIATLAAAALANENLSGDAAQLEWVQTKDAARLQAGRRSPAAAARCSSPKPACARPAINVSGYLLFRSAATLQIDAGAPVGSARILCSMRAPGGTEVAQTPGLRASYPRSSDDLIDQPAVRRLAGRIQLARDRPRGRRTSKTSPTASPPSRGSSSNGRPTRSGSSAGAGSCPPVRRPKTWCCRSRRSGGRRRSPRSRSPAP